MKIEEQKARIAEIDTIRNGLLNKCDALLKEKNELLVLIHQVESGLSLNDAVKFTDGREVKTGVITAFKNSWGNTVRPVVTLHKKDGSLGTRTRDWFRNGEPVKIATP